MLGLTSLQEGNETRACSLGHVKTQQEGGCPQTRKRALTRTQPCWYSDLDLTDFNTTKNKLLLCKPPNL